MDANGPKCPACGNPLAAGAPRCTSCGAANASAVAKRTVLGMAPMVIAPPTTPAVEPTPASSATPPSSANAPVSAARVVSVGSSGAADAKIVPGTMMGVRVDALRAGAESTRTPNRTMLGVAVPGVAPTHEPPPASQVPAFVPPPPPPSTFEASPQPEAQRVGAQAPAAPRSRAPIVAIVFGGLALAAVAIVVVLWARAKPPPRLAVERHEGPTADELVVRCDTCGDDAEIATKDQHVHFSHGQATLSLPHEGLVAGKNVVATTLTSGKKSWPITLDVAIPFLARASLDRLARDGVVEIALDVAPQIESVKAAGNVVRPKEGKLLLPFPLEPTKDEAARTFTHTLKFVVNMSGGESREGSIALSLPYATLKPATTHVGTTKSPVLVAIGGGASIGGRASPSAHVVVGGTSVDADASGSFRLDVKADDATDLLTVVAFASGAAPRAVDIALQHAKSVDDAFRTVHGRAKTPPARLFADPDAHLGEWTDVTITVKDAKQEDGRSVVAGEVRCASTETTCPAVRALLPVGMDAKKDDVLRVGGVVTRTISLEKGKSKAAEVEALVAAPSK